MQGHRNHSQAGEPGTGIISRLETCRGTEATHILVSQGQESSAGLKPHRSHSLTREKAEESSTGLKYTKE
jgi:hypothetical protein